MTERGEWLCDIEICGRHYNLFAIRQDGYRLGIWYEGASQVRDETANARELEMGRLIQRLEAEVARLKYKRVEGDTDVWRECDGNCGENRE